MRVLLLATFVALASANYEGYQLLRVFPTTPEHLAALSDLQENTQLDFFTDVSSLYDPVDILVPPALVSRVSTSLKELRMTVEVRNSNVQTQIDAEKERLSRKKNFDYYDFNDFTTVLEELGNLKDDCPEGFSCSVFSIGQSWEGRDLVVFHIDGPGEEVMWFDSAIHAREWLSPSTNMLMLNRFVSYEDEDAVKIMDNYDMYFLPIMNPDGYEFTWTDDRYWRKNRRENDGICLGVDLNRNYDYDWGNTGSSGLECSSTYRGPEAASEPETQAVQDYVTGIGGDKVVFITFHTYGRYWLVPYGDCSLADNWNDTMRVTEETVLTIEAVFEDDWLRGNSCEVLYATSGSTADWAQGGAGVPYSYTPELRGDDFVVDASEIALSEEQIWPGLVKMVETIRAI